MTGRRGPGPAPGTLLLLCAVAASAGCLVASGLTWLSLPDGAGGTTFVSGWGGITGGSQIAGTNLNDPAGPLSGHATFRPGVLALIVGLVALLITLGVAAGGGRRRPRRILASALALCGLVGLGWGVLHILRPDSLGVLDPGEGAGGAGCWLTAGCSVVLLAVGAVLLAGAGTPSRRGPGRPGGRRR